MKTWVNTSTEVAEYSHRSVESIWRRNEAKNSLSSGAIHCSPCSLFGQFRVSKRSSKLRRMSPASWVNLPNTFAMFASVLALKFPPWKLTHCSPKAHGSELWNGEEKQPLGVREKEEMVKKKSGWLVKMIYQNALYIFLKNTKHFPFKISNK